MGDGNMKSDDYIKNMLTLDFGKELEKLKIEKACLHEGQAFFIYLLKT